MSGLASAEMPVVTITVNGRPVTIDQRTMTMRERSQVKAELAKLAYPADEMDALVGAIWVALRRDDPTVTFDDVAGSVTLADLADAEQVEGDSSRPEA